MHLPLHRIIIIFSTEAGSESFHSILVQMQKYTNDNRVFSQNPIHWKLKNFASLNTDFFFSIPFNLLHRDTEAEIHTWISPQYFADKTPTKTLD